MKMMDEPISGHNFQLKSQKLKNDNEELTNKNEKEGFRNISQINTKVKNTKEKKKKLLVIFNKENKTNDNQINVIPEHKNEYENNINNQKIKNEELLMNQNQIQNFNKNNEILSNNPNMFLSVNIVNPHTNEYYQPIDDGVYEMINNYQQFNPYMPNTFNPSMINQNNINNNFYYNQMPPMQDYFIMNDNHNDYYNYIQNNNIQFRLNNQIRNKHMMNYNDINIMSNGRIPPFVMDNNIYNQMNIPMNIPMVNDINITMNNQINNSTNRPIDIQNSINQKKVSKKLKQNKIVNFNEFSLNELLANSNILSKDQTGCRYLQKKIKEQPEIVPKIFNNALQNIKEIVNDCFGNYLIQKLFDYLAEEQFCQLIALLQINIFDICTNSYGTRVIQKIIEYLNTDNLIKTFMTIIQPVIKDIILDINGSHIVLKILSINNPYANNVVFKQIHNNIITISNHKHGCCVLQKCIDKADNKQRIEIINKIMEECNTLIIDQCGNYIIQYIIGLNMEEVNNKIIDKILLNIEDYSKQKYSSNVVEKSIELCSDELCQKVIDLISNDNVLINNLLFDKFGNYVVQKVLQRSNEETQKKILKAIVPHFQDLKKYPFGLKLYSKLIINYSFLSVMILNKNPNDIKDV